MKEGKDDLWDEDLRVVCSVACMCACESFLNTLTLIYVEEGLSEFAGEQWLRKVSEKLLHHVGHVVRTLILVVYTFWRTLAHLSQSLDPRLHPRLTEKTHLTTETP